MINRGELHWGKGAAVRAMTKNDGSCRHTKGRETTLMKENPPEFGFGIQESRPQMQNARCGLDRSQQRPNDCKRGADHRGTVTPYVDSPASHFRKGAEVSYFE